MLTVLISTTRAWNPGDDFIRAGVKRVVVRAAREAGAGEVQFLAYDRNPDRLELAEGRRCRRSVGQVGTQGNSWHHERLAGVDLVVIGGTPSWTVVEHRHLFERILKERVPVVFVGIGAVGRLGFESIDERVFRAAKLVVCRDRLAAEMVGAVRGAPVEVLGCPAFLTGAAASVGAGGGGVAVVWQTVNDTAHAVPIRLSTEMLALARDRELPVICHYVHEFLCARRLGLEAFYSDDWRDYVERIYPRFGAVVSARLHGAVLASGMRRRAVCVRGDERSGLCLDCFPWVVQCGVDGAYEAAVAAELAPAAHAAELEEAYVERLGEVLKDL